jgi:MerR family transcriptional regulator, thiopeptide resistance regulator
VVGVDDEEYTVGAVAKLAGVSVRLLHHYDRIGLLKPSGRSAAGYRIYSLADLKRLQQVLFYRELGFTLEDIARILADPGQDELAHLRQQHRLLREQISRRQGMLTAIEKELEAGKMGIALSPEEQFEIFGTDKVSGEWAEEAQRRWGDTDAWAQSQRRAAAYTKQDWIDIRAEATAINRDFLAAMSAGTPADDPRGSTTALMTCIAAWPSCTWPTSASASTTTTWRPASPGTCTTPCWPTRAGPRARTVSP